MRPVFADPKTDFVFKKLFGTEQHKGLLLALLNHLLETDEAHRILDLSFLSPDQRPPVDEMKLSIVDVKCVDAQGTSYVVEMQVLNVEGFEKRVVYNASKAYTAQLGSGQRYPELNDVIAVSICDFLLWPPLEGQPSPVPMLSRWRMQEQHGGARGLSQVQYVFLELPKYAAGDQPRTEGERWAYFFHAAADLGQVPSWLAGEPMGQALEAARTAHFTPQEWDAYDRAKIAEQDARGALSLAHRVGLLEGQRAGREDGLRDGLREGKLDGLREGKLDGLREGKLDGLREGKLDGLREGIRDVCEVLGIAVGPSHEAHLASLDAAGIEALRVRLKRDKRWA